MKLFRYAMIAAAAAALLVGTVASTGYAVVESATEPIAAVLAGPVFDVLSLLAVTVAVAFALAVGGSAVLVAVFALFRRHSGGRAPRQGGSSFIGFARGSPPLLLTPT